MLVLFMKKTKINFFDVVQGERCDFCQYSFVEFKSTFLIIPFYLQSVPVQSENCVKTSAVLYSCGIHLCKVAYTHAADQFCSSIWM
jgi:hypothetical protein